MWEPMHRRWVLAATWPAAAGSPLKRLPHKAAPTQGRTYRLSIAEMRASFSAQSSFTQFWKRSRYTASFS